METSPAFRRAASASAVVALHVLLAAALLLATRNAPVIVHEVREITFALIPAASKPNVKPKANARRKMNPARAPEGGATVALPIHPPDTSAFHGLLFDCEPGSRDLLSAEDRARCDTVTGGMKPSDSPDYTDRTNRAHDAARWARALARKQPPALLPCASPQGIGISIGTLICLGKGAIDGFDLDTQPGYFDKPEAFHLPNNGDPKPLRQPLPD